MRLDVVTPEGAKVRGMEVSEVVLPGIVGEMGILEGHVAMIAALGTGRMIVYPKKGDAPLRYAVSSGYCEVLGDVLRVIVETCERSDEIDEERAKQKLAEVTKKLEGVSPADGEAYNALMLSFNKASTRLEVLKEARESQR